MRTIPIKKTKEIEERLETSLLMADSQLRSLIGQSDKPLAIRAYQQKRMRIVQMVNELSIVSNQVVSEAIMDVANQVANTQQEATNDLLIENDDVNLMLDLSDVPRLTLEGLEQRYHIETLKISSNVWAQKQIREIETVITSGIARGQSARSMSNQLSEFVLGGGVGMGQSLKTKTMRLARTEINNSYWEASRASSEQSPVVGGIKWELSGRHPQYDVCDLLVNQNLFGLGRGVYPPEYLPPKPHPNCLCYQLDVLRDPDEFDQERPVPTLQKDIDKVRIGKGGQGFSKGYKKRQLDLFRNVVRATIEQRGVVMPFSPIPIPPIPIPEVLEVPADFVPAATFDEAVKFAEDNFAENVIFVNKKGKKTITLENLNSLNEGIYRVFKDRGFKVGYLGNEEAYEAFQESETAQGHYVGKMPRRAVAFYQSGEYLDERVLSRPSTLIFKKRYTSNPLLNNDNEVFLQNQQQRITELERYVTRLRRQGVTGAESEIENTNKKIEHLKQSKRFTIMSGETEKKPAIVDLAIHEAAHALFHRGVKAELWSEKISEHNITKLDKLKVSDYATTLEEELFTETTVLVETGRRDEIPERIQKAYDEAMDEWELKE